MHHKRSVVRIVDLDNGVLGEYRGDHTSTGTDLFELDQHEVLTLFQVKTYLVVPETRGTSHEVRVDQAAV
jgi:hypothetical protein